MPPLNLARRPPATGKSLAIEALPRAKGETGPAPFDASLNGVLPEAQRLGYGVHQFPDNTIIASILSVLP